MGKGTQWTRNLILASNSQPLHFILTLISIMLFWEGQKKSWMNALLKVASFLATFFIIHLISQTKYPNFRYTEEIRLWKHSKQIILQRKLFYFLWRIQQVELIWRTLLEWFCSILLKGQKNKQMQLKRKQSEEHIELDKASIWSFCGLSWRTR